MPKFAVKIKRNAPVTLLPFADFFQGFEKVPAVREIFGPETSRVLNKLKVEFFSSRFGYMSVNDKDGHLLISTRHLKNSKFDVLYLDVIHELFHVKQFLDGRRLYLDEFDYVDSPIEVEAYRHTVKEARRLGMSDEQISDYLKVEWTTEEQHARLLKALGMLPKKK